METTNVVNEVVEDAVEEAVKSNRAGIAITGVCAITGAAAIVYGTVKGAKWLYNKVNSKIAERKDLKENIVQGEVISETDVEE